MIAVMLKAGVVGVVGALILGAGFWTGDVLSSPPSPAQAAQAAEESGGDIPSAPAPAAAHPAFAPLRAAVDKLLRADDASAGVTLTELGGASPQTWSLNGDEQFTAA